MSFKIFKMSKEERENFMNDVINILKGHVESKIETPGIEILHYYRSQGREAVSELIEESLTSMVELLETTNSTSPRLSKIKKELEELKDKKKS